MPRDTMPLNYSTSMPPMHAPVADHLQWLAECMADTARQLDSVTLDHEEIVGLAAYYRELAIKARFLHMAAPPEDAFTENVVRLKGRSRPRRQPDSPTPPTGGSVA